MAVVFDHAGDGDGQIEGSQGFFGAADLGESTIDKNQVGQGFIFVKKPAVAPTDGLLNAGAVVGMVQVFDREFAVVGADRFAVSELDHTADHLGGAEVGDIEGFNDMEGRQADELSQFFLGAFGGGETFFGQGDFLIQLVLSVFVGQTYQFPQLASFGNDNGQEFADGGCAELGDANFFRHGVAVGIALQQK